MTYIVAKQFSDRDVESITVERLSGPRAGLHVRNSLLASTPFGNSLKSLSANTTLLSQHVNRQAADYSEARFDKEAATFTRASLNPDFRNVTAVALSRGRELTTIWADLTTPQFPVAHVPAGDSTALAASIAASIADANRREAVRRRIEGMKLSDALDLVMKDDDAVAALIEGGRHASGFPSDLYDRAVTSYAERKLAKRYIDLDVQYRLAPDADNVLRNGIDVERASNAAKATIAANRQALDEVGEVGTVLSSTLDFAAVIINGNRRQAFELLNAA